MGHPGLIKFTFKTVIPQTLGLGNLDLIFVIQWYDVRVIDQDD